MHSGAVGSGEGRRHCRLRRLPPRRNIVGLMGI